MDLLFYFGFYLFFFGIILALLFMLKSPSSKNKKNINKEAKDEIKEYNLKKENKIYKGLSLIPDSIFGVGLYVLIILFCIWIFGDFGGECGVDYKPRFFGEC